MASQVQIPFEGVILQEHSAPISCPTPNFAKGSRVHLLPTAFVDKQESPALAVPIEVVLLLVLTPPPRSRLSTMRRMMAWPVVWAS